MINHRLVWSDPCLTPQCHAGRPLSSAARDHGEPLLPLADHRQAEIPGVGLAHLQGVASVVPCEKWGVYQPQQHPAGWVPSFTWCFNSSWKMQAIALTVCKSCQCQKTSTYLVVQRLMLWLGPSQQQGCVGTAGGQIWKAAHEYSGSTSASSAIIFTHLEAAQQHLVDERHHLEHINNRQ